MKTLLNGLFQAHLEKLLNEKPDERAENGAVFDRDTYLRDTEGFDDVEVSDCKNLFESKTLTFEYDQVVVAGRNSVQVGKKGERAEKLFLHYSQRWAKDYLRRRLDWVVEDGYGRQDYASNTSPRHLKGALCPCQVSCGTGKFLNRGAVKIK